MKRLILFIISFLIIYLLGSFYNCSFNIHIWNEESRFVTAILGGLLGLIVSTHPYPEDLFK
jgi:hypothetical protein